MSNPNLYESFISYSDVESKRFGMRVFRGTVDEINEQQLLSFQITNNIDLAIMRLPANKHYQIKNLDKMNIHYVVADTLVYYALDLANWTPKHLRNTDLVITKCDLGNIDTISSLITDIFSTYKNHYSSNYYIKANVLPEAYVEWANSYILNETDEYIAWIVQIKNKPVGFITCRCNEGQCEIALNGVTSSESGKGIYSDIIRFVQQYYKDRVFSTIRVSTQIQNLAVQKVWYREGFELSDAYITIHINFFRNKSQLASCLKL